MNIHTLFIIEYQLTEVNIIPTDSAKGIKSPLVTVHEINNDTSLIRVDVIRLIMVRKIWSRFKLDGGEIESFNVCSDHTCNGTAVTFVAKTDLQLKPNENPAPLEPEWTIISQETYSLLIAYQINSNLIFHFLSS